MTSPLKQRRKALDLTQEEVAQALGTTKATIMKLERGHMQLTESWMKRLAVALQCQPTDFLAESWPSDVPMIGLVDDSDRVALYRPLPAPGLKEPQGYWDGLELVERPPEGGYAQVIALRVQGEGYAPLLPAGSLVYAADPLVANLEKYLNQVVLCVAEDGVVRLGKLQPSSQFGEFSLLSLVKGSAESRVLEWCAKVIFFKPV